MKKEPAEENSGALTNCSLWCTRPDSSSAVRRSSSLIGLTSHPERYETNHTMSSIERRACREPVKDELPTPCSQCINSRYPRLLRHERLDAAAVITRHYRLLGPQADADDGGAGGWRRAQGPAGQTPRLQSVAALRSAHGHQRGCLLYTSP